MRHLVIFICIFAVLRDVGSLYQNETLQNPPDPASQQLDEFRRLHPVPIGVLTKVSGEAIDVSEVYTLNKDIFANRHHFRVTSHNIRERIPERVVHAKGVAAHGYFEVTHDVSRYIKSDVFNGIGKKTPLVGRFSTAIQNLGGTDLVRETKAIAIKMYTKEGNLDIICLHLPIFLFKDPILFQRFAHSFKRNPRTNLFDNTARWDFMTLEPDTIHTFLWLASDFGLPDGYRKMDVFPEHAYEVYNKHGERFIVKFNFRTEQGLSNLTDAQAAVIGIEDPDYYNRDLYNAIAEGNYPAWRLEMDVLTMKDIMNVDYDPFDTTRLWKRGTYRTVTVGRMVYNRRVDNHFKNADISAFSPDNLVPGIVGAPDPLFRARKIFYPDAQHYRLKVNFDNLNVNAPLYREVYVRDGLGPVKDNMWDAPNYYPNSFNGPMPYVDETKPKENLIALHRNAVDLQPMAEFYHEIVDNDSHRQRLATVVAISLVTVPPDVEKMALRILTLISVDLGNRVRTTLAILKAINVQERRAQIAQFIGNVTQIDLPNFSSNTEQYQDIRYH